MSKCDQCEEQNPADIHTCTPITEKSSAVAAPVQDVDWKDMYEKQKRRSEMWIAKYEKDIGPLEKAVPVAVPVQQKPLFADIIAQHPGLAEELKAMDAAPVQERKPFAYANPDDLCADTAFRWCKIDKFTTPVYTTPPAQPAPVQPVWFSLDEVKPIEGQMVLAWYKGFAYPDTAVWLGKKGWAMDSELASPYWDEVQNKITHWMPLPQGPDSYTTPPAAPVQPVAQAWDEGYRAGINDERISEANIGIAGFGAKVEPDRINPYCSIAPAADTQCEDWMDREGKFEIWWKREGQFGRSGGGQYEKTFAWNAWCAALAITPPEAQPVVPLTDEQILALWEDTYVQRGSTGIEFAKAIEAAHGITKGGAV